MDKNTKTILAAVLMAIVVMSVVGIIVVLPRLTTTTETIAPSAPESKPKAATISAVTKTMTVTVPKFTSKSCPWGQGDNLARNNGHHTARIEKSATFSYSSCVATGATIKTKQARVWLYDDVMGILLDNKILSTWAPTALASKIGSTWNWLDFRNYSGANVAPYTGDKLAWVCPQGATKCTGPMTKNTGNWIGDSKRPIDIELPASVLSSYLASSATGSASHTLTSVVIGDNNPETDCRMTEDLVMVLTLSCTESVPECRDSIDNDGDGKIDCTAGAEDPGCFPDGHGGGGACNRDDDSEIDVVPPQCSDKIDNDEDGKIDCTAGAEDPGCFPDGHGGGGACNPTDDDEVDVTPPQCSDGKDNDEDGKVDCVSGKADPGCFPDGHGGGGACNPTWDDEEDAIIQWGNVCSADLTLSGPVATPTPTPTRTAVATPTPAPTATPTPAPLPETVVLPTATPTPVVLPEAGLSLPTIGALGGGVVMILLGILLAL